ncbi:MAG: hypothetical protein R2825_18105 [Saprospiraceae bacterium]
MTFHVERPASEGQGKINGPQVGHRCGQGKADGAVAPTDFIFRLRIVHECQRARLTPLHLGRLDNFIDARTFLAEGHHEQVSGRQRGIRVHNPNNAFATELAHHFIDEFFDVGTIAFTEVLGLFSGENEFPKNFHGPKFPTSVPDGIEVDFIACVLHLCIHQKGTPAFGGLSRNVEE